MLKATYINITSTWHFGDHHNRTWTHNRPKNQNVNSQGSECYLLLNPQSSPLKEKFKDYTLQGIP